MRDTEILLYHNHSEESNRVADLSPELDDFIVKNHYADYAHLIEELPDDVNPVIVRTEHAFKRAAGDNKSFHQEFWTDVLERGGQIETHGSHITGTLGENEFAVIDGVEPTYNQRDQHLLIAGLPIGEDVDAWNIDQEQFFEYAEDAAWAGIPHWNIMTPSGEEKQELIHRADDLDDVDLALSHNGGYGTLSKYVNDEIGGESEIERLSSDYDLPVIPELDTHSSLPYGLDHVGVLENGTIDQLRDGNMPVKALLDADTVDYGFSPWNEFRDDYNFGFTQVMPSLANEGGAVGTLAGIAGETLGYSEPEDYREKMRKNFSTVASSVDAETLRENASKPYSS